MLCLDDTNSKAALQKKSMIKAFTLKDLERFRRAWWRFVLLSSGSSKKEETKSRGEKEVVGGRETLGEVKQSYGGIGGGECGKVGVIGGEWFRRKGGDYDCD
ncbi:hypothetical protein OIU84_007806 [Salix udensis]|uniref:Uncharacterized protein n=1 Tax=Salix udensis TaxID=889485 RepID=A0AAD6JTX0_9ROSI|nr:hypothetical protein OIU84_007806 [Salix udensis]